MIGRWVVGAGLAGVLAVCVTALPGEKVLYDKASAYTTIIVTDDGHGLRTLSFDHSGARQSVVKVGDPDHIELAYARAMLVGLAFHADAERILIVGLGGGTIPSFLRKHYPRVTIDVVDIDPDVVGVAKKFFGFREDAAMRAHVADGRRFVEACKEPYDLIFLDAYGADSIPYHLATREFLQGVRRALSPKGVVLANVWSRSSNALYDSMVRTYQDVFDELYVLTIDGSSNRILVAVPDARDIQQADLLRRARAISTEKAFRFDLGDLVAYGFHGVEEPNTHGRVLTDKKKAG